MAYDYDADILAGLWTGAEKLEEPYASFIASIDAALTDDDAENRILSTIELLRSHMELIGSRTEANVFHVTMVRLMRGAGSGGFVYDAVPLEACGNITNPVFPAGASVEVTSFAQTPATVINAITASGGDIDTVVGELNADLLTTAVAEVYTITTESDTDGNRGGKYFTINSAGDATAYYVWMSHSGQAEVTDFTFMNDDSL